MHSQIRRADFFHGLLTDGEAALGEVFVDAQCMDLPQGWDQALKEPLARAHEAMSALEAGAIANQDEHRMVGHYWLRDPARAPSAEIRTAITDTLGRIRSFAADVHAGKIRGSSGQALVNLLVVGIGGSALGPQFVAGALVRPDNPMRPFFFDNTDPDGMDRTLAAVAKTAAGLAGTLVVIISKSGGTKETRNGQLYAEAAFTRAGLDFAQHAIAVTGDGSELYHTAARYRARFPMWDFVGGRTSELSAVGLLPAALQGLDIDGLLAGARAMDALTRQAEPTRNPAMLLAACWHHATNGAGRKDMVILPYKDRLELFSRYLQQLVMESLGKELDRAGHVVHQGISVYGNKGSTDQHAYVQQLRDGVDNFFVTFIEVLRDHQDAAAPEVFVEEGVTSGDYLLGFLLGSQRALAEKGRRSVTITVPDCSASSIGALIALYERTVGIYGELININAYHQPGVEAGKKAAAGILRLQAQLVAALTKTPQTALELCRAIGTEAEAFAAWKVLEHLSANGRIGRQREGSQDPLLAAYFRRS